MLFPSQPPCLFYMQLSSSAEKVVGTATPQEPPEEWQASWNISTGNELLIRWASPTSSSGLNFVIRNKEPTDRMVQPISGITDCQNPFLF